jgi:hypothetical protein
LVYSLLRRAPLTGDGGLLKREGYPRAREDLCGKDGKMKPSDLKKAAPYLGALLLVAVVFYVVRSLL